MCIVKVVRLVGQLHPLRKLNYSCEERKINNVYWTVIIFIDVLYPLHWYILMYIVPCRTLHKETRSSAILMMHAS